MIETSQWGPWQGPNLNELLQPYADAGLRVTLPGHYREADAATRQAVSGDVIRLLQKVFRGDYPLTEAYATSMAHGMGTGDVNPFNVHDAASNELLLTAAIVNHTNDTTGNIQSAELGRAGKSPSATVSAKNLLRARVTWAGKHRPGLNFLYSSLRSSQKAGFDNMPGGQAILGIWLGAERGPLMPTQTGYDYRAGGGVEPFTRIELPMQPLEWSSAVAETPIYVPSAEDKSMLEALLEEGTHGAVTPNVVVSSQGSADGLGFHEVVPPNNRTLAKYIVSENVQPGPAILDANQLDTDLTNGISQKVVIEADVATRPDGAAVMAGLRLRGWTFVGWQASEQIFGAVCPVMARVNPRLIGELIMPGHHPEQFDPRTRAIFDNTYKTMLKNAGEHPAARLDFSERVG